MNTIPRTPSPSPTPTTITTTTSTTTTTTASQQRPRSSARSAGQKRTAYCHGSNSGCINTCTCSQVFITICEDIHLLQCILSYVGNYQNRYVGSVNRNFHTSYVTLYPQRVTHRNASTIEHVKIQLDDINAMNAMTDYQRGEEEDGDGIKKDKDDQRRELWQVAGRQGNMEVIQFLHEKLLLVRLDGYDRWKHIICRTAAGDGNWKLLQWAVANDVAAKSDDRVCVQAIGNGHMDIFHWAVQKGFDWEIETDACIEAGFMAAEKGHLKALKWLNAHHYDFDMYSFGRDFSCTNYAAKGGHVKVLRWLDSIGCPWNDQTCNEAVIGNHMDVLEYLLDNYCPATNETCALAARDGNMAALRMLNFFDVEFDSYTIAYAAGFGHWNSIEWARRQGCPWSETACQYAAGFGRFDILKRLRSDGCPWDTKTTEYALTDEIYDWAVANGCPVQVQNELPVARMMPRPRLRTFFQYLWDV